MTDAVGASQFPIETWTPLVTVLAAYDEEGGGEVFTANQVAGTAAGRWTMPYRADCDPEVVDVVKLRRLVANGRVHDVIGATQIGRRQGLEFRTIAQAG